MDIRRLNLYLDNEEYTCEDKLSGLVLTKIGVIGTIFLCLEFSNGKYFHEIKYDEKCKEDWKID